MLWIVGIIAGAIGGNLTQTFSNGKFSLGMRTNTIIGVIGGLFGTLISLQTPSIIYVLLQGVVAGFAFTVVVSWVKNRNKAGD